MYCVANGLNLFFSAMKDVGTFKLADRGVGVNILPPPMCLFTVTGTAPIFCCHQHIKKKPVKRSLIGMAYRV
ncbi:hypothetical protein Hanom_Chr00s000001g01597631 [Helianthus anomalus]